MGRLPNQFPPRWQKGQRQLRLRLQQRCRCRAPSMPVPRGFPPGRTNLSPTSPPRWRRREKRPGQVSRPAPPPARWSRWELAWDWSEKILHIDPDGGNGMLELLIIALVVAVLVTLLVMRMRAGRRTP